MTATATLTAALVVLIAAGAGAQTFTAVVRGAVRTSGDAVPGVTVQLVNEETNASRESVSNAAGEYGFFALPPGAYTMRAAREGFKTYERTGIRVATQQFLAIDVELELGQIHETLTVSLESPLIESSTASTGFVIDARRLNSPLAPPAKRVNRRQRRQLGVNSFLCLRWRATCT